LPFEGQHSSNTGAVAVVAKVAVALADAVSPQNLVQENSAKTIEQQTAPIHTEVKAYIKPAEVVERKKFTAPTGILTTSNLGIKSILDPPKNKLADNQDALLPDIAENFSLEKLKQVWNDYALIVRSQKKDNLYTTLTNSELTMTPDYKIQLEISNSAAVFELEREKSGLLGYLRSNLKNYQLTFNHKVSVNESASPLNSRATFEKLSEENPALLKLQKMFNLDIDY